MKSNTAYCLLKWYDHIGIDEALADSPVPWYNRVETKPPTRDISAPKAKTPQVPVSSPQVIRPKDTTQQPLSFVHAPHDEAVMQARTQAQSAQSLDDIATLLHQFNGCALKATAKNTCISRGTGNADLMLIGEAPGRDEDLKGVPFVGRAGQLLDKMLCAIGHDEQSVYITNIVYWRPPGNRTPSLQESHICQPFLERQIELVAPKVIVFLGGAAAKHMFKTSEGIMRLRGKWKTYSVGDSDYKAIATLHPAYLLRNPIGKRMAWQDLLNVKIALDGLKP
ncbi:MAG: uracil-DNA glycosylase [Pseudomonadota bacterium]